MLDSEEIENNIKNVLKSNLKSKRDVNIEDMLGFSYENDIVTETFVGKLVDGVIDM